MLEQHREILLALVEHEIQTTLSDIRRGYATGIVEEDGKQRQVIDQRYVDRLRTLRELRDSL